MGLGRRTRRLALVGGAAALSALATLAALAACVSVSGLSGGGLDASPPDADAETPDAAAEDGPAGGGDADAGPPCNPDTPFGAILGVANVTTTLSFEQWARLSGDELEIVYQANRGDPAPHIFHAKRATRTDVFGTSAIVSAVVDPTGEYDPALSRDGLTLVFASARSGSVGQRDLWVTTRPDRTSSFSAPSPVTAVNTAGDECQPYLDPGNAHLWFARDNQIYVASRSGSTFGAPSPVTELNVQGSVGFPVPSDDGSYIYFFDPPIMGDGGPTDAGSHIWFAQRPAPGAQFAGLRLVTELESAASDFPTWLSPDGCRIYLTSTRAGADHIYFAERSP
jgi:Tol biopolymer transport system component